MESYRQEIYRLHWVSPSMAGACLGCAINRLQGLWHLEGKGGKEGDLRKLGGILH